MTHSDTRWFAQLSARSQKCLGVLGITTIEQLRATPETKLLEVRGFGRTSAREIRRFLERNPPTKPAAIDSDSAIRDLRERIVQNIEQSWPIVHRANIDAMLAEFADSLIDRERDLWSRATYAIRDKLPPVVGEQEART